MCIAIMSIRCNFFASSVDIALWTCLTVLDIFLGLTQYLLISSCTYQANVWICWFTIERFQMPLSIESIDETSNEVQSEITAHEFGSLSFHDPLFVLLSFLLSFHHRVVVLLHHMFQHSLIEFCKEGNMMQLLKPLGQPGNAYHFVNDLSSPRQLLLMSPHSLEFDYDGLNSLVYLIPILLLHSFLHFDDWGLKSLFRNLIIVYQLIQLFESKHLSLLLIQPKLLLNECACFQHPQSFLSM